MHLSEIKSWVTSRYVWTWNEGWCMIEWDFTVLKCGKSCERNSNCLTLRIHPLAPVQWLDFDFFFGSLSDLLRVWCTMQGKMQQGTRACSSAKAFTINKAQRAMLKQPSWKKLSCTIALNWHICDWRQPLTLGSQVPYKSLYLGVSSLIYELPLDCIANFLGIVFYFYCFCWSFLWAARFKAL